MRKDAVGHWTFVKLDEHDQPATTRQFMEVTDALFSDSTPHSTWLDMVESIRAVCVKISALAIDLEIKPAAAATEET
eukprot:3687871-Amphidinium_carterae.1